MQVAGKGRGSCACGWLMSSPTLLYASIGAPITTQIRVIMLLIFFFVDQCGIKLYKPTNLVSIFLVSHVGGWLTSPQTLLFTSFFSPMSTLLMEFLLPFIYFVTLYDSELTGLGHLVFSALVWCWVYRKWSIVTYSGLAGTVASVISVDDCLLSHQIMFPLLDNLFQEIELLIIVRVVKNHPMKHFVVVVHKPYS